jgi:hypothetical protein
VTKSTVPANSVQSSQTAFQRCSTCHYTFIVQKDDMREAIVYLDGIFRRISQYCVPRHWMFSLLNAYRLTYFLTSSLALNIFANPEYIFLRSYNWVHLFTEVLGYRLGGCRTYILRKCFLFFLRNLQKRPSNSLFQTARGSGATLSECTFQEKCTSLRVLRSTPWSLFRKYLDKACFYSERLRETGRLPSSTMIRSGAYR